MPRCQTVTFVSGTVTANGGSLNINRTGLPNWFNIWQLIVTPSIAATSMKVEIFKRDTFLVADGVCFRTRNFTGPLIQPKEDSGAGPVQRNEGKPIFYEDLDASGELHLKLYNNHTLDMTYTVTVVYEPRLLLTTDASLALSGTDADDARVLSQVSDSTRQKVLAKVDGVSVGTVPILDFKSGTRITVSGVLNGTTAEITVTGANQVAAMEALFWSHRYV